ncbi:winged helix-turn-helix domain-containing protein [Stygiolobus sp. CP850M]|uniref:winged helix-turn-helix domain-containing protein n=1 Tax=Stygiolobus sp. CP850M TaxID=3133134 RepID=UPI00307FA078
MKKILADYSLKYFPKQEIIESKPYDLQIVKYLVRNPRAQAAEIAQETGLTQKLVEKRTKILLEKGIVKLIPIIDLKKTDVVMFYIFTRRVAETRKILDSCKILEINDGQAGIIGCITDRIENVRKYVEAVRNVADREADVMVIYDYLINSGFSL